MNRRILLLVAALLLLGTNMAWSQASRLVTGRVLDETGFGYPGAPVTVTNSSERTVTDADGNFSITMPDGNNSLTVTVAGYLTQTVTVTGNTTTIRIQPESRQLEGTVVTALGITREKKSLGYSTSTVDGDLLRSSGEQNVIQGLSAKAPGIQVTSSAGTPGASSKILIRGNSSFTGENQPLIVVDGVPVDNSTNTISAADNPYNQNLQGVNESNRALDLNPEDIESVSILKGPAAASLYGARGANGAILYTTKRGKARKGIGVTLSSSVEASWVNKLPELQDEFTQGNYDAATNTFNFSTFDPGPDGIAYTADDVANGTANSWGPRASTAGIRTYNNVDRYFQTGVSFNNNATLYGGNEESSFRIGIGNSNNTGVIPNSKMNRTSVRITGDSKLSKRLSIGATVNYTNTSAIRPQNGSNLSGAMLTLLRTPINFDISNYKDITGTQRPYFSGYDNPLFSAYENPYNDETNRILGNLTANYSFTDNLKLTVRSGADYYNTETEQIFAIGSRQADVVGAGQINRSSSNSKQLYTDVLLTYNKPLSETISINALAGYNFTYNEASQIFARGRQLALPYFYNFSNASELFTNNSSAYSLTQAGFAEIGADYKSQVFVSITGRNEWSSASGRNSRGFFYPKADIAWVFNETFKLPRWFSYGKVRGAYANSGNAPSSYSDINYYVVPFVADGSTSGLGFPYQGSYPGYGLNNIVTLGGLRPERVSGGEVGLELSFLGRRIAFEGTYYRQTSEDLLLQRPVGGSSGFQAWYKNAGTLQNQGFELALNLTPVKTRNFQWNLNTNWARNRSEVLRLDQGVSEINIEVGFNGIYGYATVGEPYGVLYGTKWERNAAGQLLLDEDGYPSIDPTIKRIGNPNPDWLMGINNEFNFKGLAFSFLWDIRKGGDLWNGTYQNLNFRGRSEESADRERTYVIDGVYAPGTPNAGQPNTTEISAYDYFTYYKGSNGAQENAIQDGGWVRLRAVNLGYTINIAKNRPKASLQSVYVGLTGRNLLLFTNYKGVDPETSLTGAGSNLNGFDYYNNPGTKSVMFNVRLNF